MRLLVLYRAECPETTAALSAPCPASYSTVPHPLTSSAASHPTPYFTLPLPLSQYIATSTSTSTSSIPPICTTAADPNALPYRIRVPFFTVLYWPRPASSAPAAVYSSSKLNTSIRCGVRRGADFVIFQQYQRVIRQVRDKRSEAVGTWLGTVGYSRVGTNLVAAAAPTRGTYYKAASRDIEGDLA